MRGMSGFDALEARIGQSARVIYKYVERFVE
jgi:hypothetical protein